MFFHQSMHQSTNPVFWQQITTTKNECSSTNPCINPQILCFWNLVATNVRLWRCSSKYITSPNHLQATTLFTLNDVLTTNNNHKKWMFFHQSMWQQITTTKNECSGTNPWLLKPIFRHFTNWMTCNNRWWTSVSFECYWFERRPFTTIVYNEIFFQSLYFSHSFCKTWICFLAMM
jgi:hypothetical protein